MKGGELVKKSINRDKKEWLIQQLAAQPIPLKEMIASLRADEREEVKSHACNITDDDGKVVARILQCVRIYI
jgi:hypothetical protein